MTLNNILLLIAFSGLYIGFITLIFSLCKAAKIGDQTLQKISNDYYNKVGD